MTEQARPRSMHGDQVRVSVLVAVPTEAAFRLFTEEIDQWWLRGPRYRIAGRRGGILHMEPKVGGRLFESVESASGDTALQTGRVLVWEPPRRLVFEWRARNFAPSEKTEVEVLFASQQSGTRVTVTHSGWAHIRPDHPARHGLDTHAFLRMMGLWWGELMTSLREHTESSS